jgi:alanine dehydrogenase
VIGAVLVPGANASKLVSRDLVKRMKRGSVIVDVAIDQGGCIETSKPTSHAEPTYIAEDVVHYCVTNMPGAVAGTSTFALNNATLPFIVKLADKGIDKALKEDQNLANGVNIKAGKVVHEVVREAIDKL